MPGRKYSATNSYRYGFNGKENDNEVKGEGNQQDYGMRVYDPRLGKFLSVDPLAKSYPWYTPYQFAGNMPINSIDLDGLEPVEAVQYWVGQGPAAKGGKIGSKKVFEVIKGVIKTAAITLGAFTELAANAHYGDKVKNKEEAFPLTHGNPFYAVKQMLVAPAELIIALKNDPTNGELYGEGMFMLLPIKGTFKVGKNTKVDLMGGRKSTQGNNWLNYDINAVEGIRADVTNFNLHFPKGSVKEIVANNPQATFLQEVHGALKDGGTITVRGQMANSYFKEIWEGKAEGLKGYEIVEGSKKTGLSTKGYEKSDGTPLQGAENSLNEIILRKKKL